MLKVFEAFSGYGSQSMALKRLGIDFEVVTISEIDKDAILAYAAIHCDIDFEEETPSYEEMYEILESKNIGCDFKAKKVKLPKGLAEMKKLYLSDKYSNNLGDISKVRLSQIPGHDLFTYSFPCQDISVAGNQKSLEKGSGTRSSLLWECERIIRFKRPKYLLLENVKNLVGKKHKPYFDEWLKKLEEYGYKNYWQVLNAKDYGVPQNRERVFVISILGDGNYRFPKKQELKLRLKDVLESEVDEKYYLSEEIQKRFVYFPNDRLNNKDLEVIGTTTVNPYDNEGNLIFDKCTSAWVYNPNKLMSTLSARDYKQPKQILEPYPVTKEGNSYAITGATPRMTGIENIQKKQATLVIARDYKIRKLTPLECWRLMDVSDEDFWKVKNNGVSDTQLYKLAGNSIVVNVLVELFRNLLVKGE